MINVFNHALSAKKKALFLLFSVVIFCACEGPQGPQGPRGYDGKDGKDGEGVNWKIAEFEAGTEKSPWEYTSFSDNNYYFAKFSVPALTSFVFTDGNVNGYIYMQENGQLIQHSLPYVLHKYQKDTNGNVFYFTETVDFVYGVGWVQIEVRDSDFAYEDNVNIVPDIMKFRIVMTW